MRVFKPLSKVEREVSERKRRVQERLKTMSRTDRLALAQAEMRPFQQIRSMKVTDERNARLKAERERTTERIISRDDRFTGIPRTTLPRVDRSFAQSQLTAPPSLPKRTSLQTVREYSGKHLGQK